MPLKKYTEGETNGREMKESILSRLQVNNKSTKCVTVYCLLFFTLLKRPVELRQIFGLDFI